MDKILHEIVEMSIISVVFCLAARQFNWVDIWNARAKRKIMNQQQVQTQKQVLKFSPQQIQMLNLLQLNAIGIEERIKDEIEENPAIEEGKDEEQEIVDQQEEAPEESPEAEEEFSYEDYLEEDYIPDYRTYANNSSADDEVFVPMVVQRNTFQDQIKDQLAVFNLDPGRLKLARYIVDSLDDDGYLRIPLSKLADDFSFMEKSFIEEEELARMLSLIQQCDPPGVGARKLKECLLIQLKRQAKARGETNTNSATYIVQHFFNELSNKNYDKIIRESGLGVDEIREAMKVITHLNPKPISGSAAVDMPTTTIIPEFIVNKLDDKFEIMLTNQNIPSLRLNKKYVEMMEVATTHKDEITKSERQALQFVRQKINAARWFIDAIKQREQTMLKTITAIVELQKEFFLTGDRKKLQPMILKDVAEKIEMDISTASRVTSTKYVQTPYGTMLLKDLFSTGLQKQDGEEVSNKKLQQLIAEMIETENKKKPYTDFQIATQLKSRGYILARRTVAKYREKLQIPMARLRTELM